MDLFKKRLQSLLDEKGLNQKELAKLSGVTEVTISRYMNDNRKPRIEIASKIATVLDTTTDYLLGNSDIRNPYKEDKDESFPEEFTKPDKARAYINKHQIFGSGGFDADKLDDEEIIQFANELLQQMKMVSYKYKKWLGEI